MEAVGVPERRVVAFGRSVGSIYAIQLVSRFPNIAGLVIESGIADPLERVLMRASAAELGVTLEELEEARDAHLNHKDKLASYPGPVFVLHTRFDGLVDLDNAERLRDWADGDAELVVFEEGNHNSIMAVNWSAYWKKIGAFVESLG